MSKMISLFGKNFKSISARGLLGKWKEKVKSENGQFCQPLDQAKRIRP